MYWVLLALISILDSIIKHWSNSGYEDIHADDETDTSESPAEIPFLTTYTCNIFAGDIIIKIASEMPVPHSLGKYF